MSASSSSLHFSNALLSEEERGGVAQDIVRSLHDIDKALYHLSEATSNTHEPLPNKVIGRVCKVVRQHHSLKYSFSVSG
jgi:hypothetical protein